MRSAAVFAEMAAPMGRVLLVVSLVLLFCGAAQASQLIDRKATNVQLAVSSSGVVMLSYTARGRQQHVRAWGARDALAPTTRRPQVEFRLDYSGNSWSDNGGCQRYTGPPLTLLVAACTAPDGSYWAVQRWHRVVHRGAAAGQGVAELRLSHWTGRPASFVVKLDWSYGRFDHLYGSLAYRGKAVHGFRSTRRGSPIDTYGRNIYVDTRNSSYGRGWHRENGFLAQSPRGNFCYEFYRGAGDAYRATVIGPGVTPDLTWQAKAPGPFDAVLDSAANLEQKTLFAGSRYCRPN